MVNEEREEGEKKKEMYYRGTSAYDSMVEEDEVDEAGGVQRHSCMGHDGIA